MRSLILSLDREQNWKLTKKRKIPYSAANDDKVLKKFRQRSRLSELGNVASLGTRDWPESIHVLYYGRFQSLLFASGLERAQFKLQVRNI